MPGGRVLATTLAVLLAVAAAGCGSPPSSPAAADRASVRLVHVPEGTADVEYDPAARVLTVAVHATGMMAGEALVARIRRGDCSTVGGDVVDVLPPGMADARGVVDATARVPGVEAVPASSAIEWLPAAQPAQPVLCGDLTGQTGAVRLGPSPVAPGAASGSATLALDPGARTLTVRLVVQGLTPGSRYPANIHDGSCAAQGPLAYRLPALRADSGGRATLRTTVSGVSRIGRWYLDIHRGPTQTGAGAAPLSCGDVDPA